MRVCSISLCVKNSTHRDFRGAGQIFSAILIISHLLHEIVFSTSIFRWWWFPIDWGATQWEIAMWHLLYVCVETFWPFVIFGSETFQPAHMFSYFWNFHQMEFGILRSIRSMLVTQCICLNLWCLNCFHQEQRMIHNCFISHRLIYNLFDHASRIFLTLVPKLTEKLKKCNCCVRMNLLMSMSICVLNFRHDWFHCISTYI